VNETKDTSTKGLLSLFRDRNFSLLWASTVASQLGDHLNLMALTALIFSMSAGAIKGLEFSKILLLASAPVLIFGPISGVYADRLSRKKMMVISDVLRALLVASIPFLARSMVSVYVILFIVFTINRFHLSAKSAAVPQIVTNDRRWVRGVAGSLWRGSASRPGSSPTRARTSYPRRSWPSSR
jgi:MFS family permease